VRRTFPLPLRARAAISAAMSKNEEHVLVVKREFFNELGSFQGLCRQVDDYLPAFLKTENNFFTPRAAAEQNPSLKQIIPYAVFLHGGRILHYTRGSKSGEKRLVAKASIGIGGHVNDTDESLPHLDQSTYQNAVRREIREELRLGGGFTERAVALINDDSTEVGSVHLGVVHLVELENDSVTAGEKAIAELGFATLAELLARRESFEIWSQIVLDALPDLTRQA
jgi:predicted NUDIX family phosphoesterase